MLSKIAYIIDSSCLTPEDEVAKLGYYYLPLRYSINNKDYIEVIGIEDDTLRDSILNKDNVTTSQPSPGDTINLINKLKKEGYDEAIFACIASGLSKTGENVALIGENEGFKVHVLDTRTVGPVMIHSLKRVQERIEKYNWPIQTAIDEINVFTDKCRTYLFVDDLFHLSRGGRITQAAAALGSMLKIKPILSLEPELNGYIDVVAKIRTQKKALRKMAEKALDGVDLDNSYIMLAHFYGEDIREELKKELLNINPNIKIHESRSLSSVIGVHTGLGTVGVMSVPRIDVI